MVLTNSYFYWGVCDSHTFLSPLHKGNSHRTPYLIFYVEVVRFTDLSTVFPTTRKLKYNVVLVSRLVQITNLTSSPVIHRKGNSDRKFRWVRLYCPQSETKCHFMVRLNRHLVRTPKKEETVDYHHHLGLLRYSTPFPRPQNLHSMYPVEKYLHPRDPCRTRGRTYIVLNNDTTR